MILDILKANIRQQLINKNMSIAELERRAGIPHAIINIMHGRSKNPTIRVANAIAKELGCTVDELLNENTNISNKKHIELSTPWDLETGKLVFIAINNYLVKNHIKVDIDKIFFFITEIYKYTIGSPNKKIDHRFIEWFIQKNIH